jgi:restriction endonuclease Mrr
MIRELDLHELTQKIDNLEQEAIALDAELKLLDILRPLLEAEGYHVEHTGGPDDMGIDFLAKRSNQAVLDLPLAIGIQYKHQRHPVGANVVQQIIGVSLTNNIDQMILLSKSGFSQSAWEMAKRDLPTAIELVDLQTLRAWVKRLERKIKGDYSKVVKAITHLSKQLARIIAENPGELANMEWRDMERMLASVFEGLGFKVELTPPSKDGGKDIILEFSLFGTSHSYLVEVKHWRSKQRVGQGYISHFVNVVANEKRQGGLYLATYGYTQDAFEALTEIEKSRIHIGGEEKVVSLCKTFVKAESGIWSAPVMLTDIIVENTLSFEG